MAWIYLAESADSQKPWKGMSAQSPIVKTTDTPKEFFSVEWLREIYHSPLYGTTSKRSIQKRSRRLTSFTADSHVRTSALRAAELAWEESEAAYSSRSLGLSAKYDLPSSSWRTSQQSLFGGGNELLENFAGSGMTRDGAFYPLQTWARITDAKDGGFWRTPDTGAGGTSGLLKEGKTHRTSGAAITMRLVDQVNSPHMWPTPTTSDDRGPASNMLDLGRAAKIWPTPTAEPFRSRGGDRKDEMGLDRMAKMFPTPTVFGNNNKPKPGTKRGMGLSSAAKMWPTPTVQDSKNDGGPSTFQRNTVPLNAAVKMFHTPKGSAGGPDYAAKARGKSANLSTDVGGSLNPQFVEWLMGYPKDWTVIESWAERKK